MTNRGSDCVMGNNLDKRWKEEWKGRKKGNGKEGRQGNKETGKGVCGEKCRHRGQTLWDFGRETISKSKHIHALQVSAEQTQMYSGCLDTIKKSLILCKAHPCCLTVGL